MLSLQSTRVKKVNIYFCKEPDIETIMKKDKISRQALKTIRERILLH